MFISRLAQSSYTNLYRNNKFNYYKILQNKIIPKLSLLPHNKHFYKTCEKQQNKEDSIDNCKYIKSHIKNTKCRFKSIVLITTLFVTSSGIYTYIKIKEISLLFSL